MKQRNWDDRLKQDMKFAMENLLEYGSLVPMFVLHTRSGQILVVGASIRDQAEKEQTYRMMTTMCIAHDVVGFCFIAEAWLRMVNRRHNESEAEMQDRSFAFPPSEAEDRIEVVSGVCVYRDEDIGKRQSKSTMVEILRGDDTKVTGFQALDLPGNNCEGLVIDILPEKRPSKTQQTIAQRLLDKSDHIHHVRRQ
jgi:hypothetical protein